MPRPRSLSNADYAKLESVAKQRDALPTDSELAQEMGTTTLYVRVLMCKLRRKWAERLAARKPKPAPSDVPQNPTVESIAEEVHQDHLHRLDVDWSSDLVPRPFNPRPRPQSAILSTAAAEAIQHRETAEHITDVLSKLSAPTKA